MGRFDKRGDKSEKDFQGEFGDQRQLTDFNPPSENAEFQTINHRLFTRVPEASEVGEREIVFSKVGSVKRMHTKIQGEILSVILT